MFKFAFVCNISLLFMETTSKNFKWAAKLNSVKVNTNHQLKTHTHSHFTSYMTTTKYSSLSSGSSDHPGDDDDAMMQWRNGIKCPDKGKTQCWQCLQRKNAHFSYISTSLFSLQGRENLCCVLFCCGGRKRKQLTVSVLMLFLLIVRQTFFPGNSKMKKKKDEKSREKKTV